VFVSGLPGTNASGLPEHPEALTVSRPTSAAPEQLPWKLYDEITNNFIIANFQSSFAIDTDDGCSYFHVHHNVSVQRSSLVPSSNSVLLSCCHQFFVYGQGGLKTDYGGHDNRHHDNVYAFLTHGKCVSIEPQRPGYPDAFHNNYCVFGDNPDWTPGRWAPSVVIGLDPYIADLKPNHQDMQNCIAGLIHPTGQTCTSYLTCTTIKFGRMGRTVLFDA
jgi:hypothetical protein